MLLLDRRRECLPLEVAAQKHLIAWLHALQMGTLQSLMGEGEQDAELVKMAREEQQELAKQVLDSFQCSTAVTVVLHTSDAAVKTRCSLKLPAPAAMPAAAQLALEAEQSMCLQVPAHEQGLLLALLPKDEADERGVVLEVGQAPI